MKGAQDFNLTNHFSHFLGKVAQHLFAQASYIKVFVAASVLYEGKLNFRAEFEGLFFANSLFF